MVKEISEGRKNRKYTISQKLEIVKYAKETNNHQAAAKYNVDRKSIREWRLKEEMFSKVIDKEERFTLHPGRKPKGSKERRIKLRKIKQKKDNEIKGKIKRTKNSIGKIKGILKRIKIKGKKNVYIIILADINQLLSLIKKQLYNLNHKSYLKTITKYTYIYIL